MTKEDNKYNLYRKSIRMDSFISIIILVIEMIILMEVFRRIDSLSNDNNEIMFAIIMVLSFIILIFTNEIVFNNQTLGMKFYGLSYSKYDGKFILKIITRFIFKFTVLRRLPFSGISFKENVIKAEKLTSIKIEES